MDIAQFASALLAIVVIDIVLAGDNAIVIALAARSLPERLRKRAIVWGAVGAIAVRSAMTLVVVWLLRIPGLMLFGGLLLVWIAYKLLLPDEGGGHEQGPAATTFWAAMRTIVIADAAMGLDNVLAVAGAAHGSYVLVVLGLLISVPIVVWGSTLVLKVVDRYPGVVYLGSAVLVWTAAKMITGEPLLKPWLQAWPQLSWLVFAAVPLVLWAGFVRNHQRLASRISTRLASFTLPQPRGSDTLDSRSPSHEEEGDRAMLKVLVPVDGSANALRAVRHAIGEYRRHHELEIHLLNVQAQLSRHIARFVSRSDRQRWHLEKSVAALAEPKALLDGAGVPYCTHWAVGDRAHEICAAATRLKAHHIVMGTARKSSITRMLEDSTTSKVLESTPVPVEVVAGEAVSKWERWGLPASVVGLGWLLFVGLD
jgi:YjbE family integral membrane protein